mmetsp:Transcript_6399/g.25854  ORF Transcript_6399/g.25854 Transcript_6399/m.25854 type:complete len:234 (-) Transcript_6399:592-1293(-)
MLTAVEKAWRAPSLSPCACSISPRSRKISALCCPGKYSRFVVLRRFMPCLSSAGGPKCAFACSQILTKASCTSIVAKPYILFRTDTHTRDMPCLRAMCANRLTLHALSRKPSWCSGGFTAWKSLKALITTLCMWLRQCTISDQRSTLSHSFGRRRRHVSKMSLSSVHACCCERDAWPISTSTRALSCSSTSCWKRKSRSACACTPTGGSAHQRCSASSTPCRTAVSPASTDPA